MAHKAPLRVGVTFCSGEATTPKVESNSLDEPELKGDIIRRVLNYAMSENHVKKTFNFLVEVLRLQLICKNIATLHSKIVGIQFERLQ